jgi:YD repeat-containing protein
MITIQSLLFKSSSGFTANGLLLKIVLALMLLAPACLYASSVSYTYDAAGRLTKADYGSGKTIAYLYDNAGNLSRATSASVKTLADVILVLQVAAGMETQSVIRQTDDVNGDGRIGLAEAVYILQKVGGAR